jgi:hypothetical protein
VARREPGAEPAGIGIGDDLGRVVASGGGSLNELVEPELLGPGDLDDAAERVAPRLPRRPQWRRRRRPWAGTAPAAGRTVSPSAASSAMRPANSTNWLASTIEKGTDEPSVSFP